MKMNFYLVKRVGLLWLFFQSASLHAENNNPILLTDTLTSTQLVEAVLQANPQLEIAQATWQAAIANITQQASWDDPQFNYRFAPLTANTRHTSGQTIDFGQQFELSLKIPFPGKLAAREQVAVYQAAIKQQNIASVQLLLATQAKLLFADWYFIEQAILTNKKYQSLIEKFLSNTLTRYSTGKVNKQAVLVVKVERTLLKHQAIVLHNQQKQLQAQLNTLLNRSPEQALPRPQKIKDLRDIPSLKQLQTLALQFRPELLAIRAEMNAYKTEVELAGLGYYPDLKLSVGYNSLWDNSNKRFNIGIGINLPLDQSKRQAVEKEAKARSQNAYWQKRDLALKIRQEVYLAYTHIEESRHILKLYHQELLPLADEQKNTAQSDYQSGKGSYLSLLSSEKHFLEIQLKIDQALVNLQHHFAELEQAVGSLQLRLPQKRTGSYPS